MILIYISLFFYGSFTALQKDKRDSGS